MDFAKEYGKDLRLSNFTATDMRGAKCDGCGARPTRTHAHPRSHPRAGADVARPPATSDLRGAYLIKAVAPDASFKGADLPDALMDRAVFVQADFRDAVLVRTVLTLSDLNGADVTNAGACGRASRARPCCAL